MLLVGNNLSAKIEITTATYADQQEWDSFVHSHPNASPYHLYAWGQAITQAYGHQHIYLIARQDGEVVGVLPLVLLKLSVLLNEIVALPFCDIGGCLSINRGVERQLLTETVLYGKQLKTRTIQLRGSLRNKSGPDATFTQIESDKVRMLLALPESSESLLTSFKSKLRSQVRKSEKNGVVFRWAGEDGVDSFYSVFSSNMRDLGSPVHSKKLFQSIMLNYGDNARIGLTEFEGQCIGAGLILYTREQVSIPWASTLRQHNRLAPNMLLYWNCLKYAADNNKKTFDFGRSTRNEGTFRFKKQWGAQPVPLAWYSSKSTPSVEKEEQTQSSGREMVAAVWKKLPLQVANSLGPQLRKYINL